MERRKATKEIAAAAAIICTRPSALGQDLTLFGGVEFRPANSRDSEKIWETRPTDSTDDSARWNGCHVSRAGNDDMTIRIWRSDLRELPLERLGSQVEEPAWELVTPRIEALNR